MISIFNPEQKRLWSLTFSFSFESLSNSSETMSRASSCRLKRFVIEWLFWNRPVSNSPLERSGMWTAKIDIETNLNEILVIGASLPLPITPMSCSSSKVDSSSKWVLEWVVVLTGLMKTGPEMTKCCSLFQYCDENLVLTLFNKQVMHETSAYLIVEASWADQRDSRYFGSPRSKPINSLSTHWDASHPQPSMNYPWWFLLSIYYWHSVVCRRCFHWRIVEREFSLPHNLGRSLRHVKDDRSCVWQKNRKTERRLSPPSVLN